MMFDLTGMTALVTGASGGLGSSIAKSLAAQGARLAVSGSNVEKLESFPRELWAAIMSPCPATCRTAPRSTSSFRRRSRRSAASSTSSSTMPASRATTSSCA